MAKRTPFTRVEADRFALDAIPVDFVVIGLDRPDTRMEARVAVFAIPVYGEGLHCVCADRGPDVSPLLAFLERWQMDHSLRRKSAGPALARSFVQKVARQSEHYYVDDVIHGGVIERSVDAWRALLLEMGRWAGVGGGRLMQWAGAPPRRLWVSDAESYQLRNGVPGAYERMHLEAFNPFFNTAQAALVAPVGGGPPEGVVVVHELGHCFAHTVNTTELGELAHKSLSSAWENLSYRLSTGHALLDYFAAALAEKGFEITDRRQVACESNLDEPAAAVWGEEVRLATHYFLLPFRSPTLPEALTTAAKQGRQKANRSAGLEVAS